MRSSSFVRMRARTSGSRSVTRAANSISPSHRCSRASRRRPPSLSRNRARSASASASSAMRGGDHRCMVARPVSNHSGPAQQLQGVDAGRGSGLHGNLLNPLRETAKQVASTSSAPANAAGRKCREHSTLPRRTAPAMAWRNSASPPRNSSADGSPFQKTMIDRLQFPSQQSLWELALASRKAGHATNHRGLR